MGLRFNFLFSSLLWESTKDGGSPRHTLDCSKNDSHHHTPAFSALLSLNLQQAYVLKQFANIA